MEKIYSQTILVQPEECKTDGTAKLSALLHEAQEVSGRHCDELGYSWAVMQEKGLFWAVLRHRIYIHRMPVSGQAVTMETWPMPTTRSAYPRAVRALDEAGNILFEVVSLWVLMNTKTRAMVLPGKSGIAVPGFLRGNEPEAPATVLPGVHENAALWQVSQSDLDKNGHVNNAKYLDRVEELISCADPKEVTVCYLSEVLPGQEITLHWTASDQGILTVDGHRRKTDVCSQTERVFAVRVIC